MYNWQLRLTIIMLLRCVGHGINKSIYVDVSLPCGSAGFNSSIQPSFTSNSLEGHLYIMGWHGYSVCTYKYNVLSPGPPLPPFSVQDNIYEVVIAMCGIA